MIYNEFIEKLNKVISYNYSQDNTVYYGIEKYIDSDMFDTIINPLYNISQDTQDNFILNNIDFIIKLARSQTKDGLIKLTPKVKDLILCYN